MPKDVLPPTISPHAVEVKGTLSRLSSEVGRKRIFISAPVGYGKTTAIQMFLAKGNMRGIWIIPDAFDDSPKALCALLLHALLGQNHEPCDPAQLMERLQDIPRGGDCALVIDGVHKLADESTLALLHGAILRLPTHISVVLSSRCQPGEHFRSMEDMVLIDALDLAFDSSRIDDLLRRMGSGTGIDRGELLARTGGWPHGVCTALSMMGTGQSREAVDFLLANYLDDELGGVLHPQALDFLLQMSVVPQFTQALCRGILRREDHTAILQYLWRHNFFMPGGKPGVYTLYPHLIRYFQIKREAVLADKEKQTLYRRALAPILRVVEGLANENSVDLLYRYSYHIIHTLPAEMVQERGDLAVNRAWCSFLRAESGAFKHTLAHLQQRYSQEDSTFYTNCTYLSLLDGHTTMGEWAADKGKALLSGKGERENITMLNLPYAHRALRDMSEILLLGDDHADSLMELFDCLIGKEFAVIRPCIHAGLDYERGAFSMAYRRALQAYALCGDHMGAEAWFNTYAVLWRILLAVDRKRDAQDVDREAREKLAQLDAGYLLPNWQACVATADMQQDNREAAEEFLLSCGVQEPLLMHKLPQHFALARANLLVGRPQKALLMAGRLAQMGKDYRRPLDEIEALLLLSRAHLDTGHEHLAKEHIVQAMQLAQSYHYTQPFAENISLIAPVLQATEMLTEQGRKLRDCVTPLYGIQLCGALLATAPDLRNLL